jgi:hypothetical protein
MYFCLPRLNRTNTPTPITNSMPPVIHLGSGANRLTKPQKQAPVFTRSPVMEKVAAP